VFCAAVSAQGTVKSTGGSVNVPISINGQLISPGDAILADDDGVMVLARREVGAAFPAALARAEREEAARAAFRDGELSLDRNALRAVLSGQGVQYLDYHAYQELP
jgi:4-hydroxy-4-methyl-2-oxoglutarate aldolase